MPAPDDTAAPWTEGPWSLGTVAVADRQSGGWLEAPDEAVIYAGEDDDETTIRIEGPRAQFDARLIVASPRLYGRLAVISRWLRRAADQLAERGFTDQAHDLRNQAEWAEADLAIARGERAMADNWRDTRCPPTSCPFCGHNFDSAGSPDGSTPSPGDVSVCISCASPLVFDEALRVRAMTPMEIAALDDETRETLRYISDALLHLREAEGK